MPQIWAYWPDLQSVRMTSRILQNFENISKHSTTTSHLSADRGLASNVSASTSDCYRVRVGLWDRQKFRPTWVGTKYILLLLSSYRPKWFFSVCNLIITEITESLDTFRRKILRHCRYYFVSSLLCIFVLSWFCCSDRYHSSFSCIVTRFCVTTLPCKTSLPTWVLNSLLQFSKVRPSFKIIAKTLKKGLKTSEEQDLESCKASLLTTR